MKKFNLFKSFLISVVAFLLPAQSFAYDFKVDELCYNINSDGTSVTVTYQNESNPRYTDLRGDLVIPESVTYEGRAYSVTSIGEYAFSNSVKMTSVIIPKTVTTIGHSAFSDCSGLLSVDIPNSVTTIASHAFIFCTKLTSVTLPNSVTEIGQSCFKGCSNLTSATLGNSVTTIGNMAFQFCTSLNSINLPNSLTIIGYRAFHNCTKLVSTKQGETGNLVIPNSVTSIGHSAFENCNGFTGSLVLPNSLTSIDDKTFYYCLGLTGNLVIPNTVTSIGDYAFSDCTGFSGSLILPNHLTSIGNNAFQYCNSFTGNLIIPNSVTSIGDHAFTRCDNLTGYIVIPNSVTSIGGYALNCSNIKQIYSQITNPSNVTLGTRVFDQVDKSACVLYVPDGKVNTYKSAAQWKDFLNIKSSKGQHPDAIAFKDTQVKSLCVANWDTDGNGEISYSEAAAVTSLGNVFKGKTNITSFDEIQFFTGLTSIGAQAFDGCTNLESVIFCDRITSIGDYAFRNCSKLASTTYKANGSLVIPNLVTTIGNGAFQNCSGFTGDLVIPNSVTSIGSYAFKNCSGLTGELDLSNSITSIGYSAFDGCSGFTGNLVIPNSITSIGSYTFHGCSGFTGNLVIPSSVTTIDYSAFSGCSGFNGTLTLPNSVTLIGNHAFDGCSGLTGELVIPGSLTSIEAYTFSGCSGFTGGLIIPNSVTSIEERAFSDCDHLTSMTIPNSVTSIGERAIDCSGLEQIISQIENVTGVALGTDVFDNVDKEACQLKVPEGTVDAYREADQWKDFLNIGDGVTKITDIAFNNDMLTTNVGAIILITPIITPNDATNTTLVWTSSDETVVTVDANGKMTALKAGVATITATTTDGTNLSATCEVSVIGASAMFNSWISRDVFVGLINQETLIPIIIQNNLPITALSFTIKLHENLQLVDDIDSFISAGERGENFDFSATQNEDGTITITGTSTTPLEAGEGTVLNLKVKTAWQNTYTIPVTNMTVTTADGTVKQLPDSETKLVMQGERGDMNGDGRVDLSDALYIINLATGLAE